MIPIVAGVPQGAVGSGKKFWNFRRRNCVERESGRDTSVEGSGGVNGVSVSPENCIATPSLCLFVTLAGRFG